MKSATSSRGCSNVATKAASSSIRKPSVRRQLRAERPEGIRSRMIAFDGTVGGCECRPYARTTILTTDRATYNRVKGAKIGSEVSIEAVNDIVSSAKGGSDAEHHMLRRRALIRRQIGGGYRKVRVRSDGTPLIDCLLAGLYDGADDDCSFLVSVTRAC